MAESQALLSQAADDVEQLGEQLSRDAEGIRQGDADFIDEVRYFIVEEAGRLDTYLAGIRDEIQEKN